MKRVKAHVIKLTDDEVIQLKSELDDLGFGADDGSEGRQADERWPMLAQLNEVLEGIE